MAVSSVTIYTPYTGQDVFVDLVRPSITMEFVGGTANYDVEWVWDDDANFLNANGRRKIENDVGLTTPGEYEKAPSTDLDTADGRPFYVRVTVTDNSGGGTPVAASSRYDYSDPNPRTRVHLALAANATPAFDPTDDPGGSFPADWGASIGGTEAADGHVRDFRRYLALAANATPAFDPTDDPGGSFPADWGTSIGGTQGADGHVRDFRRYLETAANLTVGFTPTDDPQFGDWGVAIGGTEGPDGWTGDFARFLGTAANVDTTQPCPYIFGLSKSVAESGDSVTISGQGLVGATSPTADPYDAEVRLYESADFGASYVVLPIIDYADGETLDTITVSIPGGAASGVVAVVHTTGATCPGSNFVGLTVLLVAADAKAGWWVEVWDIRNSAPIIRPLPDVADATVEYVPDDMGRGAMHLPAGHPDLGDIVDRTQDPPVQNLVKVYQHNRFSYAFVPVDREAAWGDDGARLTRVWGEGQEVILTWGKALWKDFPAQPSKTRTWLYGSDENAAPYGTFDPPSVIQNGGAEDAVNAPLEAYNGATLEAWQTEVRNGAYSHKVTTNALNQGATVPLSVIAGQAAFVDVWVKNGSGLSKTYELQLVDESGTVRATDSVAVATTAWQSLGVTWTPPTGQTAEIRILQTAGTPGVFSIDDLAAYTSPETTLEATRATYSLSRDFVGAGLHSLRIDADAGGDSTFNGVSGFFPTVGGQEYTLSAAVTGTAGQQVELTLRLGGVATRTTQVLTGTPSFDVLTVGGTAGALESVARWSIASKEAAAITFYVDALAATPGAAAANAGAITLDVLESMQARGTLDFVQPGYSRTTDSAGQPWPEDLALEISPEWSLYDLLEYLVGLGYSRELVPQNWRAGGDTGWVLQLYAPGNAGVDWTVEADGPALLPSPAVQDAKPSQRVSLSNVVYGEGTQGVWTVAQASVANLTALERREEFVSNQAAASTVTLFKALSHRLDTALTRGQGFTADLTADGDPLPWFDFLGHDRLRAHLPTVAGQPDHVPDSTYRVAAMTAHLSASGRYFQYAVDFGNYKLHSERIRDLLLKRLLARTTAENYLPGTGRVGTGFGSSGLGGVALASQAAAEQAVPVHEHAWPDVLARELGGDLQGVMPNPTVARIRSIPVTTAAPADAEVLEYDAGSGQLVWAAGGGGGGGGGAVEKHQDASAVVSAFGAAFQTDGDFESWVATSGGAWASAVDWGAASLWETSPQSGSRYGNIRRNSITMSVGDTAIAALRFIGHGSNSGIAWVISNGGLEVGLEFEMDHQLLFWSWNNPTFTTYNTWTIQPVSDVLWLGIKYEAANSWRPYWSLDGENWSPLRAAQAFTMGAPTSMYAQLRLEDSGSPGHGALLFADIVSSI